MDNLKIHKKKLQAIRTREILLETGMRCFGENGYSGCSLDIIAQAAGITKGAIYTHFKSKSELFISIIYHAYNRAIGRTRELKANLQLVDALIELLYECFHNPEFPIDHKLWGEILAVANREDEVKKIFLKCQSELREIIEKWLLDAIHAGEISKDINIKSFTDMIFIIGNGLIVQLCGDDDFNFEEAFKLLAGNIRIAIMPQV